MALVRKRTIPTERPPQVSEINHKKLNSRCEIKGGAFIYTVLKSPAQSIQFVAAKFLFQIFVDELL
jgi:hypothetical protein